MNDKTIQEVAQCYEENHEIHVYIDKYARDHCISVDEAFKHLMVIIYVLWKNGEA